MDDAIDNAIHTIVSDEVPPEDANPTDPLDSFLSEAIITTYED